MERVSWIEHKGKRVLLTNYEGLTTTEELKQVLDGELRESRASPRKIMVLAKLAGSSITPEFMRYAKEMGKNHRSKYIAKTALRGITGVKVILLNSYILFTGDTQIRSFESDNEALDWLIS